MDQSPIGKIGLALVTAGAVTFLFVVFYQVRKMTNGPDAGQWEDSSSIVPPSTVYLIPAVKDAKPTTEAATVWRDLLPGMSAESETKTLLARLYEGLPVVLETTGDPEATKVAVSKYWPNGDPGVSLVVYAKPAVAENAPPNGVRTEISAVRVSRKTRSAPTVAFDPINRALQPQGPQPDDFAALLLAANDYLLRHQTGWQVVDGRSAPPATATATAASVAEQKAAWERAVSQYLERFGPAK
jgi:hypothetical protein